MSQPIKKLSQILRSPGQHWVGDGFPVQTLFSYAQSAEMLSPFLLLDHAGPATFSPTTARRGVGEHPHRGFETVTIVYDGEVEHGDSAHGDGRIGPGDVQWMTAGSGVVHKEHHGRDFAARGGQFEMVQLWVNLRSNDKMTTPRYQEILSAQIPVVQLDAGAGRVRVIAGECMGAKGPALTFTPINVWDLKITAGQSINLDVPNGHNAALVVLHGELNVQSSATIVNDEVGVFETEGQALHLEAASETTALLLSGEPILEPVVGHGPFVMNSTDEIREAITDFQQGRMGSLSE